jgi:hypothetical protein
MRHNKSRALVPSFFANKLDYTLPATLSHVVKRKIKPYNQRKFPVLSPLQPRKLFKQDSFKTSCG